MGMRDGRRMGTGTGRRRGRRFEAGTRRGVARGGRSLASAAPWSFGSSHPGMCLCRGTRYAGARADVDADSESVVLARPARAQVIRNKKRFHQQALVELRVLQHIRDADPEDRQNCVHIGVRQPGPEGLRGRGAGGLGG